MYSLEEVSLDTSEGYVFVRGRERIQYMARKLEYPVFLLEAAALENRNCRRFARNSVTGKIVLIIDFDLLTDQNLVNIVQRTIWGSIPGFIMVDHIHPADFKNLLLHSLVGSPTSSCPPECMLEGKASDNAFSMYFNDINVVDPFIHLSDRFIIYEEGNLYQWKFADLGTSNLRPKKSAFYSKEVDLIKFEMLHHELWDSLNSIEQALNELKRLYGMLAIERQKILDSLKEVHFIRKSTCENSRITIKKPPRLGRFDYLKVTEEGYQVSTDVAPLLYRSALNHLLSVKKNKSAKPYEELIHLETVPAILMTYLCLDSCVNALGNKLKLANWESTVESSLEARIGAITKKTNGASLLKTRPDIRRKIEELSKIRNDLIHYKHEFYKTVKIGDEIVSELYICIGPSALEKTLKDARMIIKIIHQYIELPIPLWLEKHGDWLKESDPVSLLS